jgi:hypothetical protein
MHFEPWKHKTSAGGRTGGLAGYADAAVRATTKGGIGASHRDDPRTDVSMAADNEQSLIPHGPTINLANPRAVSPRIFATAAQHRPCTSTLAAARNMIAFP